MAASPAPAPPGRPPKVMSSRLMTMKFMQRAAAATGPKKPVGPPLPAPTGTPPSSKRQKTSHHDVSSSAMGSPAPAAAAGSPPEGKRQDDAARRDGAAETRWVFSIKEGERKEGEDGALRGESGLRVKVVDARGLEDEGEGAEEEPWMQGVVGRRSFGRFNRAVEKRQSGGPSSSSSSDASDDSDAANDDDDDDDDDEREDDRAGAGDDAKPARAKEGRKAKKRAEREDAYNMAKQRKGRDVRPNSLKSISSGKGGGGAKRSTFADVVCFGCGDTGHRSAECPNKRRA